MCEYVLYPLENIIPKEVAVTCRAIQGLKTIKDVYDTGKEKMVDILLEILNENLIDEALNYIKEENHKQFKDRMKHHGITLACYAFKISSNPINVAQIIAKVANKIQLILEDNGHKIAGKIVGAGIYTAGGASIGGILFGGIPGAAIGGAIGFAIWKTGEVSEYIIPGERIVLEKIKATIASTIGISTW